MKKFLSHPVVSVILKSAISILLLAGLFYYIDINEIILSFTQAHKGLLLLGFLLVAANSGIHFIRWRYLLKLLSKDITNEDVFTSLFVGFTAGFFTPAQVGEIAGRIASIPDIKKSHVLGITIIDKLYLLALTLITGILSLALFAMFYFIEYWKAAFLLPLIGITGLLFFMFLFPETMKSFLRLLPEKIREHKLYSVVSIIETTFHNAQARILFLLSSLLYLVIVVQFFIFVNAFESVSFFDTTICSLSVYFIKSVILPISIGDLGVRESASVFFFSKVGVTSAAAFNASMCMFLANVLLPSIVGALLIMRVKIK